MSSIRYGSADRTALSAWAPRLAGEVGIGPRVRGHSTSYCRSVTCLGQLGRAFRGLKTRLYSAGLMLNRGGVPGSTRLTSVLFGSERSGRELPGTIWPRDMRMPPKIEQVQPRSFKGESEATESVVSIGWQEGRTGRGSFSRARIIANSGRSRGVMGLLCLSLLWIH